MDSHVPATAAAMSIVPYPRTGIPRPSSSAGRPQTITAPLITNGKKRELMAPE